jgi:hypothetical protein
MVTTGFSWLAFVAEIAHRQLMKEHPAQVIRLNVISCILQNVVVFPLLLIVSTTCGPDRFIQSSPFTGQLLARAAVNNVLRFRVRFVVET